MLSFGPAMASLIHPSTSFSGICSYASTVDKWRFQPCTPSYPRNFVTSSSSGSSVQLRHTDVTLESVLMLLQESRSTTARVGTEPGPRRRPKPRRPPRSASGPETKSDPAGLCFGQATTGAPASCMLFKAFQEFSASGPWEID